MGLEWQASTSMVTPFQERRWFHICDRPDQSRKRQGISRTDCQSKHSITFSHGVGATQCGRWQFRNWSSYNNQPTPKP